MERGGASHQLDLLLQRLSNHRRRRYTLALMGCEGSEGWVVQIRSREQFDPKE